MRTPLLALVIATVALAGCSESPSPDPNAPDNTPPAPTGRLVQPSPPEHELQVDRLDAGILGIRFTNRGDSPADLRLDGFTFSDATGASWRANATATGALPDGLADPTAVFPDREANATLAFDFTNYTPPARLVYESDAFNATWHLHVLDYPVTIDAEDDTSFGQPLQIPRNASLSYRFSDAERDVDLCLILDTEHERWLDNPQRPIGYGCRLHARNGEAAVLVPAGDYNLGMACPAGNAPCHLRVTLVAAW